MDGNNPGSDHLSFLGPLLPPEVARDVAEGRIHPCTLSPVPLSIPKVEGSALKCEGGEIPGQVHDEWNKENIPVFDPGIQFGIRTVENIKSNSDQQCLRSVLHIKDNIQEQQFTATKPIHIPVYDSLEERRGIPSADTAKATGTKSAFQWKFHDNESSAVCDLQKF